MRESLDRRRRGSSLLLVATFLSVGLVATSSNGTVPEFSPIGVGPDPFETLPPTPVGRRFPEQCQLSSTCNAAVGAAILAYASTIAQTRLVGPSLIYADYVEWPDSCLGVNEPDVFCSQVITPGYRVILHDPERYTTPTDIEYHTDLYSHAVFSSTHAELPY